MKRFEVAVIIPTLNEEKFIGACLNSVLAQSYPMEQMDIMIVDGGSKDRTHEIVCEYGKKYPNIRFLNNPGRIQSIAFNIGVRESTAPYIVRLDAHATYNEKYIEICLKNLKNRPECGNSGGICSILPQSSRITAEANAILNQVSFGIGGAAFRVGAEAGYVDTVPFGAFPRKVIDKIGGMREDLARGEDNEYNSRIQKAGYKIYLDPEVVCTYYARDTLSASCKQMYANGESIGKLFYIDRKAIGLRHLMPMCFVLSLMGSLAIGLLWYPFFWLLTGIFGLYLLADVIATLSACREYGWKYIGVLPVLFFFVHASYGWGTLAGILKGK